MKALNERVSYNQTNYTDNTRARCKMMIDISFLENVLQSGYYIEIMYTFPDECGEICVEKILIRDIYRLNKIVVRMNESNSAGKAGYVICGIEFHHKDHYFFNED